MYSRYTYPLSCQESINTGVKITPTNHTICTYVYTFNTRHRYSICAWGGTCLEAFRHGIAPELLKLRDFVEDGIDNNEAEVAVVNLPLETLQETHLVRLFHCRVVLVLHYLLTAGKVKYSKRSIIAVCNN